MNAETSSEPAKKRINLLAALIPVAVLITALSVTFLALEINLPGEAEPQKLDRPEIPIILATMVAAFVAIAHGRKWKDIEVGMIRGINLAMNAVLILIAIGTMIGTWMLGGIVPTMIYYGLQIISPQVFLLATLIICSIISLGTGSSWSTAGTVGVALIVIGEGLGIPNYMVAGAVISGAYMGDKMSPLSDTTNLAPGVAGTDLFTHIKHMVWTTAPGYILAIILYTLLGLQFSGGEIQSGTIDTMLNALTGSYSINPLLLLAPALVIAMVVLKVPALPAVLGGTMIGAVFAMIFQGADLSLVVAASYDYSTVFQTTGIAGVDDLLNRGGLYSMLQTVGLILVALSFGGIMEKTGMLKTIAKALLSRAKSTGSLVATTIFSCIAMNIVAAEQYMSIVIPGRMYKNAYDAKGLAPENLSRALEDSATLTSPLIPWNSCGAFMYATLGVNPFMYLPFAFVNLANPVVSIIYGFTGFTMKKVEKKEEGEEKENKVAVEHDI